MRAWPFAAARAADTAGEYVGPLPGEQRAGRRHMGTANTRLCVERLLGRSPEMASEPGRGSRATIRIPEHDAEEKEP